MTDRPSKGRRRIHTLLRLVPGAREQLLVAMDEFPPNFDLDAFIGAAQSPDARERNKVAVIEREYEVLLNCLDELAARGLAEGQRLGVVEKASGTPWERLAGLGVISQGSAARLQAAKEMRDDLSHAYPPVAWKTLHEGVRTLLDDLDAYVDRFGRWTTEAGILSRDPA